MGTESGGDKLGRLVRRLREARGLSQNAVSKAAHLAPSYVNQLESGARGKRPRRDKILAIADALRATPAERAELLRAAGFDGQPDPNRPTFEQFVNGDPLIRSDQKEALVFMYRTMVREARSGH